MQQSLVTTIITAQRTSEGQSTVFVDGVAALFPSVLCNFGADVQVADALLAVTSVHFCGNETLFSSNFVASMRKVFRLCTVGFPQGDCKLSLFLLNFTVSAGKLRFASALLPLSYYIGLFQFQPGSCTLLFTWLPLHTHSIALVWA